MNPKLLDKLYQEKKDKFHTYIDSIKRKNSSNFFAIINPTLIKNPYASLFPLNFFLKKETGYGKLSVFIKNIVYFYSKNLYLYISYIIQFFIYKIYYKKKRKYSIVTIFDIFALVDNINRDKVFNENYLQGVYDIFDKHKKSYTMLLRPYGLSKNPFKLKTMFEVLDNDSRDFIFEYEFLSIYDFIELFWILLIYPFKTLELIQKENTIEDRIFNYALVSDIKSFSFDSITRYICGKNIAKVSSIKEIYSWSEFQVVERSFNYAVRMNNNKIRLNALQFYLYGEVYFNTIIDDIDYIMKSSPHRVYVNGKFYLQERDEINYFLGVSLRYENIYNFNRKNLGKNTLLLGTYMEAETKQMLEYINCLNNVIFKSHPAVNYNKFDNIGNNVEISTDNIYTLFKNTSILMTTESGTAVEAVSCGISVIIIASQDNLTANPLVEYGKGKIWDIAFTKDDVKKLYNKLIKYKKENPQEIRDIASWYKDNFFVEPTEENIIKVFELDGVK